MTWRDFLTVDKATNATTTITYAHHEIHVGSSFTTHFDNTTTGNDDHRTVIGFKTPNTTKWIHVIIGVSATAAAEFSVLEAPTVSDNAGTDLAIYNRDRNSDTTSGVLSLENPAVAGGATSFIEAQIGAASLSGGTQVTHVTLAGGLGKKAVGGLARGSEEWILKQNTKYLFIMQNLNDTANLHEIDLSWYEHTNKG